MKNLELNGGTNIFGRELKSTPLTEEQQKYQENLEDDLNARSLQNYEEEKTSSNSKINELIEEVMEISDPDITHNVQELIEEDRATSYSQSIKHIINKACEDEGNPFDNT